MMSADKTTPCWLTLLVGLIVVATDVWVFRFFADGENALGFAQMAAFLAALALGCRWSR